MPRHAWRRLGVGILAASLLFPPLSAPAMEPGPASPPSSCLQGTYIQLVNRNGGWDRSAWARLFSEFKVLQLDRLIVQWSVYDGKAFYRSGRLPSVPAAPLETILDLADNAGMQVMVGLSHDSAYWTHIKQADKRPYLKKRLQENMAAAAELRRLAVAHKSFAGWYISEEIDDLHWTGEGERKQLLDYLRQLSVYLRTATPRAAIGISGFANRQTDPGDLNSFWKSLLASASAIDIVYFQDGIGVNKLTIEALPRYYGALQDAAQKNKRTFVPVVEAFRQTAGEPVSQGPFAAAPADLHRLLRQLEIAAQFSRRRVAFGLPEYLAPSGGQEGSAAYGAYLEHMRSTGAKCAGRGE